MEWLDFLDRIARQKNLTRTQKATSIAKFPKEGELEDDRELLKKLHLTESALKKRLGGLYKIFGIEGDDRYKAVELRDLLKRQYLEMTAEEPVEPIVDTILPSPIDWRQKSRDRLTSHKQRLSSNLLQIAEKRDFDVYVPLGLVERKQKERPQVERTLDPSADRGSDLYREQTTPIAHDAFLQVVNDRQSGEHIVILGEPGAGKTTLLTKVWEFLLESIESQAIVAWIPLAELTNRDLGEYLKDNWLTKKEKASDPDSFDTLSAKLDEYGYC
jgi:predicted NACHT family NTPase